MSDRERDQIDQDAQMFIRTCSTAIQSLKDGGLPIVQIYALLPDNYFFALSPGQSGNIAAETLFPANVSPCFPVWQTRKHSWEILACMNLKILSLCLLQSCSK